MLKYLFNRTRVDIIAYFKMCKQGSYRLEKYLNMHDCLEKSSKIKFALKST